MKKEFVEIRWPAPNNFFFEIVSIFSNFLVNVWLEPKGAEHIGAYYDMNSNYT